MPVFGFRHDICGCRMMMARPAFAVGRVVETNKLNIKRTDDMEKTITVNGMKSEHCKATVEAALTALDGVRSAEVSLADRNVKVNFDENLVNEAQMKSAVDGAGHFEMVNE